MKAIVDYYKELTNMKCHPSQMKYFEWVVNNSHRISDIDMLRIYRAPLVSVHTVIKEIQESLGDT